MGLLTLRNREEFSRVMQKGHYRRSNGITVFALPSGMTESRFGIMVTTKVGKAVFRNKVRRWAKELLLQWQGLFLGSTDMVVLANKSHSFETYQEFKGHLAAGIEKLGLVEGTLV